MDGSNLTNTTTRREMVRNLRDRFASGRLRLRVQRDDPRLAGLLLAVFAPDLQVFH